jgi:hypothetical protein
MAKYSVRNTEQPNPITNDLPAINELVISDLKERMDMGIDKYGMPLQPENGRDSLIDAYQEAMDLLLYLRQMIYEKYGE